MYKEGEIISLGNKLGRAENEQARYIRRIREHEQAKYKFERT
jgi:hypothetical protein